MTNEELQKEYSALKEQDIKYNKVSSSRLLFYLSLAGFVCFVAGCCYQLSTHSFHKPSVEVQGSSKFIPEYK